MAKGLKAAPMGTERYDIFTIAAPAAALGGRGAALHQKAYQTAISLPVGGWFIWENAPEQAYKPKVKRWEELSGRRFECYKSVAGKVIVKRIADDGSGGLELKQGDGDDEEESGVED